MTTKQIWHEGNKQNQVLRDCVYDKDNGTLTVTGDDGFIATSLNEGGNFSRAVSGMGAQENVYGVGSNGKGTVVAGGRFNMLTVSHDYSLNWTKIRGRSQKGDIKKFAYGNDMFLGLNDMGGLVKSIDDGKTWTDCNPEIKSPDCIFFHSKTNLFYIGAGVNDVWRGDGNTFKKCAWLPSEIEFRGCRAIGYCEALDTYFVAGHEIAISMDGKNWRAVYDLHSNPVYGNRNIHCMKEVKGKMLMAGEDKMTLLYDGANFTQLGRIEAGAILGMAVCRSVVVGVGASGVSHIHLEDIPGETVPPPEPKPEPTGEIEADVLTEIDKITTGLSKIKALVAGN